MSRALFVFNETSPSSAGTAASSQPVQSAGSFLPAGVAGPMADYEAVDVIAELVGATGGTLDVYVQLSPDDGLNFYDFVHFAQLAAAASAVVYQAPISNATNTLAPTVVGKNLLPALSGSGTGNPAVVNGAFSDRMRLVMVAGTGTTKGASVVVKIAPQRADTSK
jgi:hypothetical protein